MDTILADLFHHHRWANRQMLEACLPLAGAQLAGAVTGTYGRLDDTLLHLAGAESRYVAALAGWTPTGGPAITERVPFPGVARVLAQLDATGDVLIEVARTLPADRILSDDDGSTIPAWVVLLQAAYHGTEHRQQIATALTTLGIEPPEPDLWTFSEAIDRGEAQAEPA